MGRCHVLQVKVMGGREERGEWERREGRGKVMGEEYGQCILI